MSNNTECNCRCCKHWRKKYEELQKSVSDLDGLFMTREIYNLCVEAESKAREKLNNAMQLLEVAQCPECDGSGAYPDQYGEPVQCRWCYEYGELWKESSKEQDHE